MSSMAFVAMWSPHAIKEFTFDCYIATTLLHLSQTQVSSRLDSAIHMKYSHHCAAFIWRVAWTGSVMSICWFRQFDWMAGDNDDFCTH